jgi:hypothetical protein
MSSWKYWIISSTKSSRKNGNIWTDDERREDKLEQREGRSMPCAMPGCQPRHAPVRGIGAALVRHPAPGRRLHAYMRRLVICTVWREDWAGGAALAEATGCSQSRHVILPSLQICTSWTAIGSLASGHCRCKHKAAIAVSRVSMTCSAWTSTAASNSRKSCSMLGNAGPGTNVPWRRFSSCRSIRIWPSCRCAVSTRLTLCPTCRDIFSTPQCREKWLPM